MLVATTKTVRFDDGPAVVAAVQATARKARADAASDLRQRQKQIQAEARARAGRLIKTARPGAHSAHSRYDAAARVLREWYLVVYDASAAKQPRSDRGGSGA